MADDGWQRTLFVDRCALFGTTLRTTAAGVSAVKYSFRLVNRDVNGR